MTPWTFYIAALCGLVFAEMLAKLPESGPWPLSSMLRMLVIVDSDSGTAIKGSRAHGVRPNSNTYRSKMKLEAELRLKVTELQPEGLYLDLIPRKQRPQTPGCIFTT